MHEIIYYEQTDSTNQRAKELTSFDHLDTVAAKSQTLGRGRMGRSFFSPSGGLYISVLLSPDKILCPIPLCTFAAAVATSSALSELGRSTQIKWVNDLLYGGKKVAGILTEAVTRDGNAERIIVGIGINLTEPEGGFPKDIKDKAGSLSLSCDPLYLAALIRRGIGVYTSLSAEDVMNEYRARLFMPSGPVTFTNYREDFKKETGRMLGVENDGSLSLLTENGTVSLSSGEILYE